jgi:hypothetical protein
MHGAANINLEYNSYFQASRQGSHLAPWQHGRLEIDVSVLNPYSYSVCDSNLLLCITLRNEKQ